MYKPPLADLNPGGDANEGPQGPAFPDPGCRVKNIAAFRRRRVQRRVIWILLLLWFIGVGWLTNEEEQRGPRRRQVEVNRLLATAGGIRIQVDGEIVICNAAIYKGIAGKAYSVDLLNAALLESAKSGPSPPELGALILTVDRDGPKVIPIASVLLLGVLVSPLIFWRYPLRILLLRPFAERAVSRSLQRLVRKNVTGWGHVITLADRHINESFIRNSTIYSFSPRRLLGQALMIPLFPLVRLPALVITVRKETHLPRLLAALNNRYNLNYFSIFDTIRKVRATNALWQRVVLCLMSNADLILVDLTVVKEGSVWELERLAEHGLLSKSIFITRQGYDDAVSAAITIIGPEVRRVFLYGESGVLTTPEDFEEAVAEFAGRRGNRFTNLA